MLKTAVLDVWSDCGWVLLHTSNNPNVLIAICTITLKVRCRMRMDSLEAENELDHHRKV